MSYIRMYRDNFIESNEWEHLYVNHSLKFVEYIEEIGLGDKIVEIGSEQLRNSVAYYCRKRVIQTVSTMNNHLNAIKKFFDFLFKQGIAENIFNHIADYDLFKQSIIEENNIRPASERGYFEFDQINELLDYFNSGSKKYSNMTMMGFFFKLTLLVPTKKKIISNLTVGDFSDDFDSVCINGINIKLPRAFSQDIRREIQATNKVVTKDSLFFELLCNGKYSSTVFNAAFCHALRQTGYDIPRDKDTFSVEDIRNTGIVNLAINNVNPYLISRLSGLSLSGLDSLLTKFEIDIDARNEKDKIINQEISKSQYYPNI